MPPRAADPFVPAPGLGHPHLQTIVGKYARQWRSVPTVRRRIELRDGDFVDVDSAAAGEGAPGILVLHGLEGSSNSGYVQQVMRRFQQAGWAAHALNFRGCSGEPNRHAKAYSSGAFDDVLEVLQQVPNVRAAVGFSLGGSVLLNLLASGVSTPIQMAAAVSVPFELEKAVARIDSGEGLMPLYQQNFTRTMKRKALDTAQRHPGAIDVTAVQRARTLRDIDEAVTAPLFGFANAHAYYASCSTGPRVHRITTPTLILSSDDDVLAPATDLPENVEKNEQLTLVLTRRGGHVGYLGGSWWAPQFFAEDTVVRWCERQRAGHA